MFQIIKKYLNNEKSFLVIGQVCIDKNYRKQCLFKGLYQKIRNTFNSYYDLLTTEVASTKTRSPNTYYAMGFKDMVIYESNDVEWYLIFLQL